MRVCHHARRLAAPGIRGYADPAMPPATDTPASPPLAAHDEQLLRDARQFQAHCASDHGADALLLPGWSVDDWAALLAGARVHTLAGGQVLMRAGQSQRSLFLLASGGLELRSGAGGSFGALVRERPGAVLGEISFFDGGPRSATVWATGPSRLLELDAAAVEAFMAWQPQRGQALLMALARVLALRVRRSEGRRPQDTL